MMDFVEKVLGFLVLAVLFLFFDFPIGGSTGVRRA